MLTAILILQALILIGIWRNHMDVQTLLANLAALSTDVDTLISQSAPVDLQPVADAIAAIDATVKAKITPPAP